MEWLSNLQLAAGHNNNITVRWCLVELLNLTNNLHSLEHLAEDHVAAIKVRGGNSGDEKLRTVGVLSGVCHRKNTLNGQQSEPKSRRIVVLYSGGEGRGEGMHLVRCDEA